jgi:hypothetical protein
MDRVKNATIIALKWLRNVLAYPFNKSREADNKDLVILVFAGFAFTLGSFFLLNVEWIPPFDAYSIFISATVGVIGVLIIIISLTGFIK